MLTTLSCMSTKITRMLTRYILNVEASEKKYATIGRKSLIST